MPRDPLPRLRKLCLALPEAHEQVAWRAPTFRVRNKLFAMYAAPGNHHHGGRPGVWCKSTHLAQDLLVRARPAEYFFPPYVGKSGWVGVYLDGKPDWAALGELVWDGYRLTAPKRLLAKVCAVGAVRTAGPFPRD